ncbi:MAG TPA: PQQ-dependent sugar dehydrogenase [Gaiellaceae bacterium]|nr:PQQ-dependent sugar dehydrogenase [Gaiellaceae bacterium]
MRTETSGLFTPISMAFLGPNDFLVLEKNTGKVKRVVNGTVSATVLDLAVNFGSERGLLGIALQPRFARTHGVYLFWTESSTGADTGVLSETPLLGNRIDRFVWNGTGLSFDRNLIRLRAIQQDTFTVTNSFGTFTQPERGNHDAGVLRFGPDGKLYVLFGDVGRRGQLQNLRDGPFGPGTPDDQFGGPQPDNAHLSGVILRLNADGSTPKSNPFFEVGEEIGGQVGANFRKVFAYGIRNSFGMAFDPEEGNLWTEENGEDAFDEINLVEPGFNGGWIQTAGPISRVAQFKQIESTSLHHEDFPNLQQFRWGPERIADTPQQARRRLFKLEESHYTDPQFSWKHVLAPAGIGFLDGRGLGRRYEGNLFVGFATLDTFNGPLFNFQVDDDELEFRDPRLADKVADNVTFHEMTESESLLFGKNFGIVTDIQTAPNGNLFVISLSDGKVYEIFRPH